MNKKHVLAALLFSVSIACHAACEGASTASPALRTRVQNPNLPYKVWVICFDTSLSLEEEQFRRLQAVTEEIVRRDVAPNDIVFLIQIQSRFDSTEAFQMPPGTTLASRKSEARQALSDAKADVIAAIHRKKQNATTTDLKSTLEVASDLLREQPHATHRLLVIGTDFLSDNGSVNPNPPTSRSRAAGVETLLLVTYPKPKYLLATRLTASSLLENVETNWAAYFKDGGARSVTVRLVDSAYASTQDSNLAESNRVHSE